MIREIELTGIGTGSVHLRTRIARSSGNPCANVTLLRALVALSSIDGRVGGTLSYGS